MAAQKDRSIVDRAGSSVSLTATLTTAFVVLSAVSLLVASVAQIALNFQAQQALVANQQQLIASKAANEVSSFVEQIFSALETAARIGRPLTSQPGPRLLALQNLQILQPAFREVALLNSQGREIVKLSGELIVPVAELVDRDDSEMFSQVSQNKRYVSSIHVDETTNEPLITVAIPVVNQFDDFQGVLTAEVTMRFMWELVNSLQIGDEGLAYVVDRQGNLIAFRDRERILDSENVSRLQPVADFINGRTTSLASGVGVSTGINDQSVVGSYVPLETPDWAVVAELPVNEAYRDLIRRVGLSIGTLVLVVIVAGVVGRYLSQRLAAPLRNLTQTATRIAAGETDLIASVEGPSEVSQLATAFNSMTSQLQELIGSLEQRVAARTQRLEILTTLSERLSAILDVGELLTELVNQVRDEFGYALTHVYIVDDDQQSLVMIAKAGDVGAQLKAEAHQIPLDSSTSLVVQAAKSGEVVSFDNIGEVSDRFSGSLSSETYAEMAIPIILEGQVVGVLDVLKDEIGGLDEGDANLLRSLANQVAIAIRNARLFEQVKDALAEARIAQERYLEQSWDKTKVVSYGNEYLYAQPTAAPLDPAKQQVLAKIQEQTRAENRTSIVAVDNDGFSGTSLLTPIKLRNKAIGTLQLHASDDHIWDEDELAIIEAVVDQLAQTADNMRLFNETRERASREQLVGQISDKLRHAPDLESLMKIGVEEISRVLGPARVFVELGSETELTRHAADLLNDGNQITTAQAGTVPSVKENSPINHPKNGQKEDQLN